MFEPSTLRTETSLQFTEIGEDVTLSDEDGKKVTTSTSKSEACEPFRNSGECSDEVVLSFDDGKKLYVSENFLCYASPVFKAMFTHDSKEKETKEVAMKEKVFDDFLEFLLCLHPGVQKPIDNYNVLRVVSLAEEYQVAVSVKKCKNVMKNWLSSEVESAVKTGNNLKKATHAKTCLNILTKSEACGFDELVTYAILVIARFGHEVFTGTIKLTAKDKQQIELQGFPAAKAPVALQPASSTGLFSFGCQGTPPSSTKPISPKETIKKSQAGTPFLLQTSQAVVTKRGRPVEKCKTLFDNLQEEMKTRLFLQRLKLCDNGEMR